MHRVFEPTSNIENGLILTIFAIKIYSLYPQKKLLAEITPI